MADQEGCSRVLQRAYAVQHEAAHRHACMRAAGQREPAEHVAARTEDLNALRAARRIRHGERAVRRQVERARFDHAPCLAANLNQFPGGRSLRVDAVYGVRAPIEDEVLPGGRLLERHRVFEFADDGGRDGADGAKDLDAECRGRAGVKASADKKEYKGHLPGAAARSTKATNTPRDRGWR